MSPLFIFCAVFFIATPAHGQLWFSDASVLFTIANSMYTDNDQVAAYVIKQLDLDWTTDPDDGKQYEYMVFVNDNDTVKGSNYIDVDLLNKDVDYHQLVDHDKIMKAYRFPKDICTEEIDKPVFETVLNLSVSSTSTADSMKQAALSLDNFGFNALGVIVNGETTKQGFAKTSGFDERCYVKYQYSTSWLIHYFGQKVETDAASAEYIILQSLLNDLQSNSPAPPNDFLAYNIQSKLEASNRGYFWVVMVNDASQTLNYDVLPKDTEESKPLSDYWTVRTQVDNFCGKNVQTYGVGPGEARGECKPGYNPTIHYQEVVTNVIATSGAIPANVTLALSEACGDFGTEAKLVLVVKDTYAGLEHITDRDCTFNFIDSGKTWKVLMYSLLKSFDDNPDDPDPVDPDGKQKA